MRLVRLSGCYIEQCSPTPCAAPSLQVWAMKEAEVATLVRQLLQADKVICEQQMGWSWHPPDDALFTPSTGPHAPAASKGGSEGITAGGAGGQQGEGTGTGEDAVRGLGGTEQGRIVLACILEVFAEHVAGQKRVGQCASSSLPAPLDSCTHRFMPCSCNFKACIFESLHISAHRCSTLPVLA